MKKIVFLMLTLCPVVAFFAASNSYAATRKHKKNKAHRKAQKHHGAQTAPQHENITAGTSPTN